MNKDLFGNEIIDYDLLDTSNFVTFYYPDIVGHLDWVIEHPDQLEFNFDEKKVGLDIKQMLDKVTSQVVYFKHS